MSTHVSAAAVWDGEKLQFSDVVTYHAGLRGMKLGQGEEVQVLVMRPEEAKRYWQLKWYYGFIVKQCVEKTGYTKREMDAILRANGLDPEVTSLVTASYSALRDLILASEIYAASEIGVVVEGPADVRERAA